MPTTSNFGWTTPADTDLVKDGALAIRTLGNGVDASFVDLKGGTTGQILSKASNSDLDFTWIANDQGDITAVTAGTGISGGGTSGAVTITNSMATAIDAKGDLIAGTGADAFSRLAVGTDGQILTADSTASTGMKWAAAAGGGANWTLKNAGGTTLSGAATITISGISAVDKIMILLADVKGTGGQNAYFVRYNSDTGNNYTYYGGIVEAASTWSSGNVYNRTTATDSAALVGGASTNSNAIFSGFHLVSGCNASGVKIFNSGGASNAAGGSSNAFYTLGGFWNGSGTVTSVSIWNNVANFTSGTVFVYTSA